MLRRLSLAARGQAYTKNVSGVGEVTLQRLFTYPLGGASYWYCDWM